VANDNTSSPKKSRLPATAASAPSTAKTKVPVKSNPVSNTSARVGFSVGEVISCTCCHFYAETNSRQPGVFSLGKSESVVLLHCSTALATAILIHNCDFFPRTGYGIAHAHRIITH